MALAAFFLLPDYPTTTKWLTDSEREIILRRLGEENLNVEGEEMGHMESLKAAFTDWRTYVSVSTLGRSPSDLPALRSPICAGYWLDDHHLLHPHTRWYLWSWLHRLHGAVHDFTNL